MCACLLSHAVTNHGVPSHLIEGMFEQSAAFFSQPAEAKAALAAAEGTGAKSGWHPTRSVKVDKQQTAADTRVSGWAHVPSLTNWLQLPAVPPPGWLHVQLQSASHNLSCSATNRHAIPRQAVTVSQHLGPTVQALHAGLTQK